MIRFLKWTGIVVLALLLVVLIIGFTLARKVENRLAKTYQIEPHPLRSNLSEANLENGRKMANALCSHCHGNDFSGTDFFNDPSIAVIHAPNLTRGKGGTSSLTEKDWLRAVRHGVKHDGSPAMVMPSMQFTYLSDEDLRDILAYVQSLPPVDREWEKPTTTATARVLLTMGAFGNIIHAETIDHPNVHDVEGPQKAANKEYGKYLSTVTGCNTCHGPLLNGAKDGDPNAPFAPNLTPGGHLGSWTESQFVKTIRTGITPEGKQLDLEYMPWYQLSYLDDEHLQAVYRYLRSLPARETTEI